MTIQSVTLRQVHTAATHPGHGLGLVKVIGQITPLESSPTAWNFDLTDGTQTVRLRKNVIVSHPVPCLEDRILRELDEKLPPLNMPSPPWTNDTYMVVVGNVTETLEIEVCSMRRITDFNELTMHYLECIYQHCALKESLK